MTDKITDSKGCLTPCSECKFCEERTPAPAQPPMTGSMQPYHVCTYRIPAHIAPPWMLSRAYYGDAFDACEGRGVVHCGGGQLSNAYNCPVFEVRHGR